MIQDASQARRRFHFLGSWTEESIKGMVGSKKRASWCWKIDSTKMPDMAEYKRNDGCGEVTSKTAAGPISWGRLKSKCWYQG